MDKNYEKALSIAEDALSRINSIYDHAETESFEDNKACKALETFIENMEDFISEIKHFSKDVEQGYLNLNSNDRYTLNSTELTCGYPIEVYNNKYQEWESGRVEHSSKYGGYYFCNNDGENISLNDGIKVRIRRGK